MSRNNIIFTLFSRAPVSLITLLVEVESEARSCSMDMGCITPEYVYRMWGGSVPLEEIEACLREL